MRNNPCAKEDFCLNELGRRLDAKISECGLEKHCSNYTKKQPQEKLLTVKEAASIFQQLVRFITEGTLRSWSAENFENFINKKL